MSMEMEVKFELRNCRVGNELGYFHRWEHFAKPMEPGFAVGSHPGGQFSKCYGIIEFSDRVERVDPTRIQFCDESNALLNAMQKHYAEDLKNGKDPFKPEVEHEEES